MSSALSLCPPSRAVILCGAFLLGFVTSVRADPKPLSKEEQAKVDKAIDKGAAFLKRTQTDEGDWPKFFKGSIRCLVGQCALPAYALLEAGVPAKDPVIQKAAEYLRPKALDSDWTYEISLAILFFDRLRDPKDEQLIKTLALRLIAGQHYTGGWSYSCPRLKKENEEPFLKLLCDLDKVYEEGKRPSAETIKTLVVPRTLRLLTVFQDRRRILWQEKDVRKPSRMGRSMGEPEWELSTKNPLAIVPTDNSNTQFAMLALWVAQRYGLPLRPTFDLMVERFERTQRSDGWWPYRVGSRDSRSMICVGLMGLAIGRGLKLPASAKGSSDVENVRALKGWIALYQEIGTPTGQMNRKVQYENPYFLWSVERVGMLYDLPTLGDKEWYRWAAEIVVTNQRPAGDWPNCMYSQRDIMSGGFGPSLNTAFALLVLQRSHPMKSLLSPALTKIPLSRHRYPRFLEEGV